MPKTNTENQPTPDSAAFGADGRKRKHEQMPPLTDAAVDRALKFAGEVTQPAPGAIRAALDMADWFNGHIVQCRADRERKGTTLTAARAALAALEAELAGLRAEREAGDEVATAYAYVADKLHFSPHPSLAAYRAARDVKG